MKMIGQILRIDDPRDVAYVEQNFVRLHDLCARMGDDAATVENDMDRGRMPSAAYVLADGTRFVPEDYFSSIFSKDDFVRSYIDEAVRSGSPAPSTETIEEDWASYLSGVYFICLRRASPQNIVRKNQLISRIDELIGEPNPDSYEWVAELRRAVDELDALEREFSPVQDRTRFGRPPTRDTYIRDVRERFLASV